MATVLKPLERTWRRILLAAGRRPFTGHSTARPLALFSLPPSPRILVIRMERIGDVLVGVPVLRALKRRFPDARIDLLVSRANSAVREAVAPFVHRVWCYEKSVASAVRLLRALRREHYDAAVDLIDHPSSSAQMVIRWCRPRVAVGLLHAESGCYTHAAPTLDPARTHPVHRFAQLLLPFGLDPAVEPLDLEYPLSAEDIALARSGLAGTNRPLRLGVNLSGRQADRYWGRDHFIAAVRQFTALEPSFAVAVCGLPRDAAEVAAVAEATGGQALPPSPSFHRFAALIRQFDLLLTPDTAVVHLAAAWKLPVVVLYQPEPGVLPWTPFNSPHRALIAPGGLRTIPASQVAAALVELAREQGLVPPAA
jgi:ADP-heptose:LPS heptosyltransferase